MSGLLSLVDVFAQNLNFLLLDVGRMGVESVDRSITEAEDHVCRGWPCRPCTNTMLLPSMMDRKDWLDTSRTLRRAPTILEACTVQ